MKRLLVLASAPGVAAATRFRAMQFFPALRAAGIEPELRPFLDDAAFAVLYERGHARAKLAAMVRASAGRIVDLLRARRYDGVFVHREAALVGPPLIEWLLARALQLPLVFDLDDAIWVAYDSPTYGRLASRLLKAPEKTLFTLRAARRVIAGNSYIADFARRFNDAVDVVPTVVNTDQFVPARRAAVATPVLGWIGTHSSAQYLGAIVPALRELAARRRFVVRVIGGRLDAPDLPVEHVPWSLEREVADFQALDIGLYPIVEDDWSRGKSGFKAVQYMACAVPVVASPVGVTREMIRHEHNGFLAQSQRDWGEQLTRLLDDSALRRRIGEAGRADAVARWSLAVHAPRVVAMVDQALAS